MKPSLLLPVGVLIVSFIPAVPAFAVTQESHISIDSSGPVDIEQRHSLTVPGQSVENSKTVIINGDSVSVSESIESSPLPQKKLKPSLKPSPSPSVTPQPTANPSPYTAASKQSFDATNKPRLPFLRSLMQSILTSLENLVRQIRT